VYCSIEIIRVIIVDVEHSVSSFALVQTGLLRSISILVEVYCLEFLDFLFYKYVIYDHKKKTKNNM